MGVRALAHFYALAFGAAAVLSMLGCLLARHLIWNATPSLPLGLYWLSRGAHAAPGTLVAFPVPGNVRELVRERRYLPPGAILVKTVVAMAGDEVCTRGGELTIHGSPWGSVLAVDSLSRPLPHWDGCGPVPEGELVVASHYAQSFDSRTFGPIRAEDVQGTVTPLWTY